MPNVHSDLLSGSAKRSLAMVSHEFPRTIANADGPDAATHLVNRHRITCNGALAPSHSCRGLSPSILFDTMGGQSTAVGCSKC